MTRITHNSVFAIRLNAGPECFRGRHFFFFRCRGGRAGRKFPPIAPDQPSLLSYGPASTWRHYSVNLLNNPVIHFVQRSGAIMRGIIIRSFTAEDAQNLRRLQAIEGYIDLGMFEEAEEELRDLDPVWFALGRTLQLQLRVLAALGHSE